MAAKKKKTGKEKPKIKSVVKGKPTSAGKEKPGKIDVIKIEELPKSVVVEEDMISIEEKTDTGSLASAHVKKTPTFYKKYAMKCMKCVKNFEHKAHIPSVKQRVKCPECGEVHLIEIIPVSGEYEIRIPKTLRVVDRRGKR
ncbi:MAG: hypothetical protein U9M95_00685 [Candidatus Altiarchaeota archaeon]|nr:hypothetical protein [Candidatus Altiarchaeota archaeon]